MKKIAIISPSIRQGRKSHRVALWFRNYIRENNLAAAEIVDLAEYRFPLFEERLKLQPDPLPEAREFAARIKEADGVIIIAPEYNGGYPASLKNVLDLLTDEWRRKPVAISTVSDGPFGEHRSSPRCSSACGRWEPGQSPRCSRCPALARPSTRKVIRLTMRLLANALPGLPGSFSIALKHQRGIIDLSTGRVIHQTACITFILYRQRITSSDFHYRNLNLIRLLS